VELPSDNLVQIRGLEITINRQSFMRKGSIALLILTLATLGVLLPALISTLRFTKFRHWIQIANYLALILITLGLPSEINLAIALALLILLVASIVFKSEPYIAKIKPVEAPKQKIDKGLKASQKAPPKNAAPATKTKSSDKASPSKKIEKPKVPPKPQKDKSQKGLFHYLIFGMSKESKLRNSIASNIALKTRILGQSELFEKTIKSQKWTFETSNAEQKVIDFPACALIETRKGARVTERSSTSSGRGYAGVRVGAVYLGGSGSSSSYSQSVSYPAPDVLQQIDSGTFIVSTRKVSFAGGMFTKNTEFKKIIDYNTEGNAILIAPSTGTKVWICRFPTVADQWVVSALIEVAGLSDDRKLSKTSKYMDVMSVDEAFKSAVNYRKAEIKLAIEEINEDKVTLDKQLDNLRAVYGSRIKK
jgi:hypothetical protein